MPLLDAEVFDSTDVLSPNIDLLMFHEIDTFPSLMPSNATLKYAVSYSDLLLIRPPRPNTADLEYLDVIIPPPHAFCDTITVK